RRDALGLSQEALAEAAKLSTTYVAMLERGERRNPGLRALRALADALGCSVEDLSAGPVDVSPALDRFLESELGAGITAEERQEWSTSSDAATGESSGGASARCGNY